MRKTQARQVKYCSKLETVEERCLRKRFTNEVEGVHNDCQEVDFVITMVKEFGEDFDYIAQEMKFKFAKDWYRPLICRGIYQRFSGEFCWGYLNGEEFEKLYSNFKRGIKSCRKHLWQKLSKIMTDRPMESLKTRFKDSINKLFKDLVYIYAIDRMKAYCKFNNNLIIRLHQAYSSMLADILDDALLK